MRDWGDRPSWRVLVFVVALAVALADPVQAANRDSVSTCQPIGTSYNNFVAGYQAIVSGVDSFSINGRSHLSLPQLPDDSVTAVSDSSTCNRAAIAYGRNLTTPDTTSSRQVYVARVGPTRYIVADPQVNEGEFMINMVFDSSFTTVFAIVAH